MKGVEIMKKIPNWLCIVIAILITIIVIAVLGKYYSNKMDTIYKEQYEQNYNNTKKDTITPPSKESLNTENIPNIPSVEDVTGMSEDEFYNMLEENN